MYRFDISPMATYKVYTYNNIHINIYLSIYLSIYISIYIYININPSYCGSLNLKLSPLPKAPQLGCLPHVAEAPDSWLQQRTGGVGCGLMVALMVNGDE